MERMTPQQASSKVSDFSKNRLHEVDEWVKTAIPTELQEVIHWLDGKPMWIERARAALDIRLAEDAAKTADKLSQQTDRLIQHTEKLTTQTDIHIQHSEKLTLQTDKLINESGSLAVLTKQLRFWTIMLGVFALVQIIIMVFDYLKHE